MAAASRFSMKSKTKSLSFPSRSHPTTLRIEEMLNKMNTTTSSTETICSGLSRLTGGSTVLSDCKESDARLSTVRHPTFCSWTIQSDNTGLYECMDDLLTSSTTQVLMSRQENKIWVNELMEESVMLLDICSNIRDMLSEIKDHSRDLLCALRRRKGDLNIQKSITKINCFRKKMKKEAREVNASLKVVKNMNMTSGASVVVNLENNYQRGAVIKAIMGVVDMTISVFDTFLVFLSVPLLKPNKWSLIVSKLIHKGMVACETQQEHGNLNELESVDVALRKLCEYGLLYDEGHVEIARCRLERLGGQIEKMERGFESMFRCLVRTRASLLNIEIEHKH